MTGISPLGPNEKDVTVDVRREYEKDEEEGSFWVEKDTGLIYEVRLFPQFALIRKAHPEYVSNLERMTLVQFAKKFTEFMGDPQIVKDFMWGAEIESFEITYKKKK